MKWFKKKKQKLPEIVTKKQPKLPEAGETWFIPEKSPCPSDIYRVRIIEAKYGFVRYSFGRSHQGLDLSSYEQCMELKRFMNIYQHFDF